PKRIHRRANRDWRPGTIILHRRNGPAANHAVHQTVRAVQEMMSPAERQVQSVNERQHLRRVGWRNRFLNSGVIRVLRARPVSRLGECAVKRHGLRPGVSSKERKRAIPLLHFHLQSIVSAAALALVIAYDRIVLRIGTQRLSQRTLEAVVRLRVARRDDSWIGDRKAEQRTEAKILRIHLIKFHPIVQVLAVTPKVRGIKQESEWKFPLYIELPVLDAARQAVAVTHN